MTNMATSVRAHLQMHPIEAAKNVSDDNYDDNDHDADEDEKKDKEPGESTEEFINDIDDGSVDDDDDNINDDDEDDNDDNNDRSSTSARNSRSCRSSTTRGLDAAHVCRHSLQFRQDVSFSASDSDLEPERQLIIERILRERHNDNGDDDDDDSGIVDVEHIPETPMLKQQQQQQQQQHLKYESYCRRHLKSYRCRLLPRCENPGMLL
jgi:hypothetical protein